MEPITIIQCPHCEGQGYNIQSHPVYRGTRDMAIDAGDMEFEGCLALFGEELRKISCEHCDGVGSIRP